jgi:flagellar protein FliS
MKQASPNAYLRTQVMTAGPLQLRLLLYDGALKFARQGRAGLENEDFEQSYSNLSRVQNIVLELSNSLNHDESPELCDRLAALYNYMYRQLVNANLNRDPQVVDEVIELLDYERETWRQLMEKVGEEGTGEQAEAPAAAAGPYQANPAPGNPSAGTSTLSKSA